MADDFVGKDGNGVLVTFRSSDIGGKQHPHKVIERILGAATFTVTRVVVTTTETPIVAARATRRRLLLIHHGAGDDMFFKIDDATPVTIANGGLLANIKGKTVTLETQAAVAGIVAANDAEITAIEEHP